MFEQAIYNKLTKPLRDSNIKEILSDIDSSKAFPTDEAFTFNERLIVKQELIETFIPWVKDYLEGFSFNFKYVTNGNTDAINMIFMHRNFNRVCFLKDEYIYYSHICKQLNLNSLIIDEKDIDLLTKDDLFLISLPASYNGETNSRLHLIQKLQKKEVKLFIDVAYCGLTNPFHLKLASTKNTYVAFTFSKTASLSFNRIGILFSDFAIPGLDIMNKLGYVNLSGANAAIAIMKNIPVDYFYSTYKKQYASICKSLDLTPTECILFGHTSKGEKVCTTPNYKTI
jgi:histidinol-phosphate/aromatic aminotransferase/cobyric acid decarboxylase-like protein